jgi:hypothetical protein
MSHRLETIKYETEETIKPMKNFQPPNPVWRRKENKDGVILGTERVVSTLPTSRVKFDQ